MTTEPVAEKNKTSWTAEFASRMGVLGELFGFLWKVKMWWMIPMIVMLFLFAVIFIFGASSPLAPFIYSLR